MAPWTEQDDAVVVELWDRWTRHVPADIDRSAGWVDHEDRNPSGSHKALQSVSAAAKAAGGEISRDERTERGGRVGGEIGEDRRRRPSRDYYDAGYNITQIQHLAIVLGSSGALTAFLKTVGPALAQWIENRGSRSVVVRDGDHEISIHGSDDVQGALDALKALRESSQAGDASDD